MKKIGVLNIILIITLNCFSQESKDSVIVVNKFGDTIRYSTNEVYSSFTSNDSLLGVSSSSKLKAKLSLSQLSSLLGNGSGYPVPPNPDNPNNWLVIPDKRNPIFSVENMGGVVALESSMYAPSPISINDTLFRVYAKGDATNSIHYWESTDSMRTWQYRDTAVYPTPSPTWDSVDIAFPLAVYDPVGDTIHLYYTGGKGTGGPEYGIGHIAVKSNASLPYTRPSAPFLSNAAAAALIGESVGFIDMSSMVKKDGEHYWFGSYSHGDSVFLFAAKGPDWRNVDSMWRIMSPYTALGYNGIINPTVYKRGDLYYGIFADSRVDADNVRDTSKSMLASMYSADLITWTRLPNFFITPRGDTSWWGKQVYDMQLLKVNGDNYDEPYKLKRDTTWGGPSKDQNEGFYYGFVSGSYFGCCLDQSGIVYILPQEEGYMNFAVSDLPVRNDISFLQRNNTLALNIPVANENVSGKLSNTDWTTFNNKAPASGSANYINNQFSTPQDASFNIDSVGYIGRKLTVGGTNADYVMNVDGYLNSGNVLNLRNASNFGINQLTTVTTEVSQLWNGAGEGYLNMFTSGGAINERFYKKNFQPVYSPFSAFMTLYGKQTDATRVEINGGNPTGFGLSRTANGTALAVNQADGYNTTSGALTSYGIVSNNTSSRESGSNALTNYAGRFVSSGGQNNYSLSLGNPAQYEANYGSLFTTRSLVDKGWVDSSLSGARVSTQFDATSTTTLADITGLTANVAAGKIYRFEAKLYTTSNVAGGVKVAIAGTATATAIVYEGLTTDAGLITQSRGTALGTAVGAVTAVTAGYITISGTITVNATGTLTVQFAQNASNGTASSVLVGSTFVITEML